MTNSKDHVVRFSSDLADWTAVTSPIAHGRQVELRVLCGPRTVWRSTEPGWGGVVFGADGGRTFLHTARSVVVFEAPGVDGALVATVGEDLVLVAALNHQWLLVCETSVRLLDGSTEVSRLEFGGVVDEARQFDGGVLVTLDTGPTFAVRVTRHSLVI